MQKKVAQITDKWKLHNIQVIYETETRAVYRVDSEHWGCGILKVNDYADALRAEHHMLSSLDGKRACRVYEYDSEQSALLEERIVPGNTLREANEMSLRVAHFSDVFQNIHMKVERESAQDTYLDWLEEANAFCRNCVKDVRLSNNMHVAVEIGQEMFEKYPDRCLLHGDLHHDNILLTKEGTYSMIDPKGIVGPEIFDTPRFVLNEMAPELNLSGTNHILSVIQELSKYLKYEEADMRKLFFMETILANVWCIEDGEDTDADQIRVAEEVSRHG